MHGPAAPIPDGRAAQGEHDARLVLKPEFQSDEVCEAATSKSLSHDFVAAHDQGRVSEHTRENTVLGERSSPAIDGRRTTGQLGYASRIEERAQAFFRAFRGPRRSRIVRTSSPVSGNRITRSMEKTTCPSTSTSYTPWSPGTKRRPDNSGPNSFRIASASCIA